MKKQKIIYRKRPKDCEMRQKTFDDLSFSFSEKKDKQTEKRGARVKNRGGGFTSHK